jgi:hypothetical protein
VNLPSRIWYRPRTDLRLYTRSGANSVIELYWSLTESVWRSGDTATLLDMQGNLRASYTLP